MAPRCVVRFWGQGGRCTRLCLHEHHPGISLTSNVTTADSSSRRPRAVVWGAEELGAGMEQGGGRSWPRCHGGRPSGRASSDRDAGAWLFFPSLGFGKRAEAGPPAGPPAQGAACSPQRERSRWPSRGRRAERRLLGGLVRAGAALGAEAHGLPLARGGLGTGWSKRPRRPPAACPGVRRLPFLSRGGCWQPEQARGASLRGTPERPSACPSCQLVGAGGVGEAPEGRERELGEPLCREQSQRAS